MLSGRPRQIEADLPRAPLIDFLGAKSAAAVSGYDVTAQQPRGC